MQLQHYVQRLVYLKKVPARTNKQHICSASYSLSDQSYFAHKALIKAGTLGTNFVAVNGQGLYLYETSDPFQSLSRVGGLAQDRLLQGRILRFGPGSESGGCTFLDCWRIMLLLGLIVGSYF